MVTDISAANKLADLMIQLSEVRSFDQVLEIKVPGIKVISDSILCDELNLGIPNPNHWSVVNRGIELTKASTWKKLGDGYPALYLREYFDNDGNIAAVSINYRAEFYESLSVNKFLVFFPENYDLSIRNNYTEAQSGFLENTRAGQWRFKKEYNAQGLQEKWIGFYLKIHGDLTLSKMAGEPELRRQFILIDEGAVIAVETWGYGINQDSSQNLLVRVIHLNETDTPRTLDMYAESVLEQLTDSGVGFELIRFEASIPVKLGDVYNTLQKCKAVSPEVTKPQEKPGRIQSVISSLTHFFERNEK